MMKRFFQIKDFIDTDSDEIAALLPSRFEENKLARMLEELKVSKKLQKAEGVTLLDARVLLGVLIDKKKATGRYLKADASIVKSPTFERGCV